MVAVEAGPDAPEPPPLVMSIGDGAPGGSPGLEWIRVREPEELRSLLVERTPDALVVASDYPVDDEFAELAGGYQKIDGGPAAFVYRAGANLGLPDPGP